MTARRARRLLGTVALGVALAGCGVTVEDQPKTVDPRDVPFELLHESPSTTTTTGTAGTTSTTRSAGAKP
jgi:hypothetical protein